VIEVVMRRRDHDADEQVDKTGYSRPHGGSPPVAAGYATASAQRPSLAARASPRAPVPSADRRDDFTARALR
jgi:hypothetical protein